MTRRAILVTGASSGIGLATARALAPLASDLYVAGRDPGRLNQVAADLHATPLVADLCQETEIQRMADHVDQRTGRLDVLINCAGQLEIGPADDLGPQAVERIMRVNFLAAVRTIHAFLPLLRKGVSPVIVNVSSIAGRMAPPFMAAYAASKFALNGYSHALRQELRPAGIHVGLVLPGPVDTPMVQGWLGGQYYPVPPGVRLLTASEVARAIRRVIDHRVAEVVVPRRLSAAARLASAVPRIVDHVYARIGNRAGGLER